MGFAVFDYAHAMIARWARSLFGLLTEEVTGSNPVAPTSCRGRKGPRLTANSGTGRRILGQARLGQPMRDSSHRRQLSIPRIAALSACTY